MPESDWTITTIDRGWYWGVTLIEENGEEFPLPVSKELTQEEAEEFVRQEYRRFQAVMGLFRQFDPELRQD